MEPRDRRFLWSTLAVLAALTAVMLGVLAKPALRLEYFFDEAWRADMIRTPWTLARYRQHDTPIPPGWLASMWAIFAVVPSKRPIVRLVALMPYFVAVGFGFDAMRRLMRTRHDERSSILLAAVVVLPLPFVPVVAQVATYLNNYLTDVAVGSVLMWGCVRWWLGDERPGFTALLSVALVGPFLGQASTFMLPAALVMLLTRRSATVRWTDRRLWVSGIAFAMSSLTAYWFFLRTVRQDNLQGFWADEALTGTTWGRVPARWWKSFIDQGLPRSISGKPIAVTLIVGLLLVGAWTMWRLCRPWIVMVLSAEVVALVLSSAKGFPFTITRVNLGFLWPLFTIILLGLVTSLMAMAKRLAGTSLTVVGVVVSLAALVVWISRPTEVLNAAAGNSVFARGLTHDISDLAVNLSPGDVVVAYHTMSGWYVHDRLMNDTAPSIVLLEEIAIGDRMMSDLDGLVQERAPQSQHVWCVIPYEVGDLSASACSMPTARWIEGTSTKLNRAELREWTRRT
jgi:hypothetical protein